MGFPSWLRRGELHPFPRRVPAFAFVVPELPWKKWYPTNWASEPGLRLCDAATRGIWFEAVNTMMLLETHSVSGTLDQLACLCICKIGEISIAVEQLKRFNVAEVVEQSGNIILSSRRRKRDCKTSEARRLAGKLSGISRTKHEHHPQQHVGTPSASTSASTSKTLSLEWAFKLLDFWQTNGADYTREELKSAFLAMSANGWMWGKNPVVDHRAALERQIQTDRNNNKNYGKTSKKPNPRNFGVAKDAAEQGRETVAFLARKQREREEAAALAVAKEVAAT